MRRAIDNEYFRSLLLSSPKKAVHLLYEYYYSGLVRVSTRYTHDIAAASDIVQESLIHVWENAEQLGQYREHTIQAYLVRVVRNKSITYYKRSLILEARQRRAGRRAEYFEPSMETKTVRDESRALLRALIATFPRKEQQCLLLRMDQEMTISQIAGNLKVTVKAVERSLTSGYKRIRAHWVSDRI